MTQAYLGIGSNVGDRMRSINEALISLRGEMTIIKVSSLYETEPEGYKEQQDFLNIAILVDVHIEPRKLLAVLKDTEKKIGRVESFVGGPRIIDIDLLFYDQDIINDPDFLVPHPLIYKRRFVLVPMVEIAAEFIHPVLYKSMLQLLTELDSTSRVTKVGVIQLNMVG